MIKQPVQCKKQLDIARRFSLPRDEITKVIGIFGQRGSGKTYSAGVIQEEQYLACGRFIIFDPVRAHAGILVLEGVEGITNLEVADAIYWADEVVKPGNRKSYLFDLSTLGFDGAVQFVNNFARHALLKNKRPLKVYIEEAHIFLPLARSRATENIVRLATVGRQYGWGLTVVSQRPAQVNKDVLTQADAIIAMRLMFPLDVDAMADIWTQAMPYDQAVDLVKRLPRQRPGQGILYSPEWLVPKERKKLLFRKPKEEIFLKQIQFRRKFTPHLAGTPKFEPEKELRQADLEKIEKKGLATKDSPDQVALGDAKQVEVKNRVVDYGKAAIGVVGGYAWANMITRDNITRIGLGSVAAVAGSMIRTNMLKFIGTGMIANGVESELKRRRYI